MKNSLIIAFIFIFSLKLDAQKQEVVIQSGHHKAVVCIAVSPDGKLLAAGEYYNRRMKIWDLESKREIKTIETMNDFSSLGFSPDGKYLTAATTANMVQLFDTDSLDEIENYHYIERITRKASIMNMHNPIAWSTNNLMAYSTYIYLNKNVTYVIKLEKNTSTEEALLINPKSDTLQHSGREYVSFAFNSTGKILAAMRSNGMLEIWNIPKQRLIKVLPSYEDSRWFTKGYDLNFSYDDKKIIAAQGSKTIRLIDCETWTDKIIDHDSTQAFCAVFAQDNNTIITGSSDGKIRYFDAKKQKMIEKISILPNGVSFDMQKIPEKNIIAFSMLNNLFLLDITQKSIVPITRQAIQAPWDFTLTAQKELALASANKIHFWDTKTGYLTSSIDSIEGNVQYFRFTPDEKQLVVFSLKPELKETVISKFNIEKQQQDWSVNVGKYSVRSPDISDDGKYLQFVINRQKILVLEVETGNKIAHYPPNGFPTDSFNTDYDIRNINSSQFYDAPAVIGISDTKSKLDGAAFYWSPQYIDPYPVAVYQEHGPIRVFALSPDKKFIAFAYPEGWRSFVWNIHKTEQTHILDGNCCAAAFSTDSKILAIGSLKGRVTLWNLATGEKIKELRPGFARVFNLKFTNDGKFLFCNMQDGYLAIYKTSNYEKVISVFSQGKSKLWLTEEGYYFSSKENLPSVAFRIDNRAYPFEQFDLKYNRPDTVLQKIGYASPEIIQAYKKAYKKRLEKMKFDESSIMKEGHLPTIKIINKKELPLTTSKNELTFSVKASDKKNNLNRIKVWNNDVPVFGITGIDLKNLKIKQYEKVITIPLITGQNKIQIACMSSNGTESLRETYEIKCTKKSKSNLYIVAIGASTYKDKNMNLKYAAKDAHDIVELFKENNLNYNKIYVDTLLNKNVTVQNIVNVKKHLSASTVNDHVIIFYAGHGLLDGDFNYYLATYNVDFRSPEKEGLPYNILENLLDGIPAQNKILLIDACHSGEIDKENIEIAEQQVVKDGKVTFRNFQSYKEESIGLNNSFEIMQLLFADLRRSAGANVISSAGGVEFALEGEAWNNGVFTYCFIKGLKELKADLNGDNIIMLSELKKYLQVAVPVMTKGQQKPTSRVENLTIDFKIWEK